MIYEGAEIRMAQDLAGERVGWEGREKGSERARERGRESARARARARASPF